MSGSRTDPLAVGYVEHTALADRHHPRLVKGARLGIALVQHEIRALSDRDESVMLVGHNPSLEELAAILCDQSFTFPTAGLATVNLSIKRWAEITAGCGTLTAFFTPGRHSGEGGRGSE